MKKYEIKPGLKVLPKKRKNDLSKLTRKQLMDEAIKKMIYENQI